MYPDKSAIARKSEMRLLFESERHYAMPDFPPPGDAPRLSAYSYNLSFVAAGGDPAAVNLGDIPNTVAPAELIFVRESVGRASNAALIATTYSENVSIAQALATAFDEAFAEAQTKLILVYQNADQDMRSIAVPAPDASLFGTDGISILPPDPGAAAGTPPRIVSDLINSVRNALNGGTLGSGTYVFLRGYRSKRAGKLPRPRQNIALVEPGAAGVPPDAPGEPE